MEEKNRIEIFSSLNYNTNVKFKIRHHCELEREEPMDEYNVATLAILTAINKSD